MFFSNIKNIIRLSHSIFKKNNFWNYRLYPINQIQCFNEGVFRIVEPLTIAIVMQGPLILEENFTVESLKLYKQHFPNAILIFSTWPISPELKKIIHDLDVHLVVNEKPQNPGISNINLQITTTRSGLLLAKRLGATHVVKTRSDQRAYNPSLLSYLYNLLQVFPVNAGEKIQKSRIIGTSLNTFKHRIYGLSDMFLFGEIDDLLLYWDSSIIKNNILTSTFELNGLVKIPEVYLLYGFILNIGYKPKFKLEDSFEVFSKHLIVINHEEIKLYWFKYNFNSERYSVENIYDTQLNFNDWLLLYQSLNSIFYKNKLLKNLPV